jgi:hypothetical protein
MTILQGRRSHIGTDSRKTDRGGGVVTEQSAGWAYQTEFHWETNASAAAAPEDITNTTTIAKTTAAEVVADRLSIAMSVIRARATGYRHATENEANCPRAPPSVLNYDNSNDSAAAAAVTTTTVMDDDDDDAIRPVAVVGRSID